MEPIKKSIVIDKKIGKETSQILVEGDIIVPDVKPDMEVILQTDASSCIDSREIINERVNFKGKLDINVLYIAKGDEKPIHNITFSTPINDFISMEGIDKSMWVDTGCEITNIDYKMINDRKISFKAVIDVKASVSSNETCDAVVNIEEIPESQQKKKTLKLSKIVDNKDDRFIIKDELIVPSGKPNIREVLQCDVCISNKEIKVSNDKVLITGELIISTLYKGESDDSIIEFMEHEVPFNGAIETEGSDESMFADVDINIQDKFYQVRPDSDGESRVLDIEISVGANIKVSSSQEFQTLEDAYCINKTLNMTKTDIKYPSLICRNKNQCPIKEIIQLDEVCPNMLQVFKVNGKIHLDDVKVIDDKVIVEGIINADILYVAESDDVPLYCYNAIIPYRQVIETKGAKAGDFMIVDVETGLEHIGFNMLSGKEVELRCVINFNTTVSEEKTIGLITDIEFCELDKESLDSVSSMTIYVVQNEDTLWNIAKKYNTSIEEIIMINEIENPNKIYPGQKLLVLKKIA